MEFSLLGAAAMAVGAFWLVLRWEAARANATGCTVDLWEAGLTAGIAGVFIGRIAAMISAGINPVTDPGQIVLVRSGVSTPAAALGALTVFAILSRTDLVAAFDAVAAAALAGLAGWHAGCLTSGGCLGAASDVPWAYALPGSDITRHPVELYAAVALALGAMAVATWRQRGRPAPGAVSGVALVIAAGVRLATEPMRVSLDGGPIALYVAGVVVGAAVVGVSQISASRSAGAGPTDAVPDG